MNSLGKLAEIKACEYLKKKKYKLLDFNYASVFGEIDLIMQKGKTICFVEVKMRNQNSIAAPAEFVDYRKQKMIGMEIQLLSHQLVLMSGAQCLLCHSQSNELTES